ncbi:MAG: DegQ family serine endoprotease [Panacagrimonas sp.]
MTKPWKLPAMRAACVPAALLLAGCNAGFDPHPDLSDMVENASPSVVNISTVAADPQSPGEAPALDERTPDWFRRFLEEQGPEPGDEPEDGPAYGSPDEAQSLGSGFILWEDGYVLTNYHVVQGAKEVIVRLLDRRQLSAKIVGLDERSDLALLKIEADDLPAVTLGDSSRLRPGQWVFAIGSPFSFDYSVTAGIVSAKGRSLVSEQYVPFIQTDVAINPGNSGGPLFNLDGEVVGVNSQIYSQSGGFQGVSFSIPIDVAAKVARQLRDRGKVTRGWLGVVVQEVDRSLAQNFKMAKPEGALVSRVLPGSPAEESGLKAGDVILSFNGETLAISSSLPPLVGSVDPGDVVKLEVMRDGREIDFKVEIGVLEDDAGSPGIELALHRAPLPPDAPLGLVVTRLSDQQRRELRVLSGGVRVEQVYDGPAVAAGLRPGDVILSVAGQEVDSPERLAEVAGRLTQGSTVPMLVSRDGAPQFLPLTVPEAVSDKPAG